MFFALACVLIFAFGGFVREGRPIADAAAGIIWVSLMFSGTLALGRAFERERQGETLRALVMAPVERSAVYLGKLLALLLLMAGIEIVLLPVVGLLFDAPLGRSPLMLLAAGRGGHRGSRLSGRSLPRCSCARTRAILLPILLYPVAVPVVIAGVQGTAAIFAPEPNVVLARMWLGLLVFFDAVFVTVALWVFEPVMTE